MNRAPLGEPVLANSNAFATFLVPLRRSKRVVYSKKPFCGPEAGARL
jgi:hypothetical protein